MSLLGLLVIASACTAAVLGALFYASMLGHICTRIERCVPLRLNSRGLVPDHILVQTVSIDLLLINAAPATCRLLVHGGEESVRSPSVPPGRTRWWSLRLDPGDYSLSVSTSEEAEARDVGRLRVEAACVSGRACGTSVGVVRKQPCQ